MLSTICYISNSVKLFPDEEIQALFDQTISNNNYYGITGILIYQEGTFIQVIEGENAIIDALFYKIERDERHNQITVILRHPIDERIFSNYKLGFRTMNNFEELKEFSKYLATLADSPYAKSLYAFLNPFLCNTSN
ncbi:BLUF domain-containing protein [Aequorivita echinoideorum]|uniref:BLUF domain-containing protein n=1 Tax=Aequorivita echinoideorum TaxID=1549647 RepID=A0ABS5S0F6_9FLAO|nr:BLUF domain-containing protein [Aequorivita echinoideorum]MBT0606697.1 BLUF domain-containing protein [Aequorivita echinoideorum]